MKKSIASMALMASSSAFGIMATPPGSEVPSETLPAPIKVQVVCLDAEYMTDGSIEVYGTCDQSAANTKVIGGFILSNGCAVKQAKVIAPAGTYLQCSEIIDIIVTQL